MSEISSETPKEETTPEEPQVRWWIDTGKTGGRGRRGAAPEIPAERVLGESIFAVGAGFDEDRARTQLTGSNMNLIREANPTPGEWAYLAPVESTSTPEQIEKTKKFLHLPQWALGVLVDSGISIRAIATGDPPGAQIVELRLGKDSSFDAWHEGEWVREQVFRDRHRALREGSGFLERNLARRDRLG
ncbi:MAG: hypothetical protein VCC00_09465 [Deltaproteobacteria bacterium]